MLIKLMETGLVATEVEPMFAVHLNLAFTQVNCLLDYVFDIDGLTEIRRVMLPWV